MVGLWVSPAEAESGGGGDGRRGEAAAVLPSSAEGPGSGPGLAGPRSSAVGSAGTRRGNKGHRKSRLSHRGLGRAYGELVEASRNTTLMTKPSKVPGVLKQEASHHLGGAEGRGCLPAALTTPLWHPHPG